MYLFPGITYGRPAAMEALFLPGAALCCALQPVSLESSGPVISVIDDDAAVRTALARLLRLHGFQPHLFESAEEFLASPDLQITCCIISDLRMPGMSGSELGELLHARGCATPVIFMTAYREEREPVNGNAFTLLIKPFDSEELLATVQAAVGGGDAGTGPRLH